MPTTVAQRKALVLIILAFISLLERFYIEYNILVHRLVKKRFKVRFSVLKR